MKKLFTIIGLVLLVISGLVVYVLISLDPSELGQKVLVIVSENTGVELTAESFELRPFQGVDLENGRVSGELDSGSVSGTVDRVILDYKLLPILQGDVAVEQIVVEGADLEVISRTASGTARAAAAETIPTTGAVTETELPESEEDSGFITAVSVVEIRVVDGNLKVTTADPDPGSAQIQGLDIELGDLSVDTVAATPIQGFSATGSIRVDAIILNDMVIQGGRGTIVVDRGRMRVSNLGVETAYASLEVTEMAADVTRDPVPYRLQAGGSYDLNSLVEAEEGGFGPASLEFSAEGSGPDVNDVVARGAFRLESGQIPAFPVMVKIERLLGKSLLVGHPYEGADIAFTIRGGNVVIDPFVMGFENLQMAGGGSIDFDGPIDLQIDIRLPRNSVSNSVLDPFIDGITDDNGWTTVPFNIGGSMAEPDVDFDMTSIKNTAREMGKRAVTDALDSAVEDLKEKTFRRRRGDDG